MATEKEYDDLLKSIKEDLDPLYFLEDNEDFAAHNDRIMEAVTVVINKIIGFYQKKNA